MKTTKRLFLQTMFVMALLSTMIACETDCEPKETIVENKLTPEILSYFPYDSLDTIHCIIDSQQNLTIRSFEKEEGVSVTALARYSKCGESVTYYKYYRVILYYDENGKLILQARLKIEDEKRMILEFRFFELPLRGLYTLNISEFSVQDTLNFGGYFYDDIYIHHNKYEGYILYYSKSKGLALITENSKPLFQLVQ